MLGMELDSSTTTLIASGFSHNYSISRARDPRFRIWGFPKIRGTFSGVPILKMNVFGFFDVPIQLQFLAQGLLDISRNRNSFFIPAMAPPKGSQNRSPAGGGVLQYGFRVGLGFRVMEPFGVPFARSIQVILEGAIIQWATILICA